MLALRVLTGLVMLFFGRQLFWLFVGVTGFLAGITLATRLFRAQPEWVILLAGLAAGLLGALFAAVLQRVAVGLAGFVAGGYVASSLLTLLGIESGRLPWLPLLIGGILGALLVIALFDWALIFLTALSGATLVVRAIDIGPGPAALLFVALLVAGIGVQAIVLQRETSPPASPSEV